MNIEYVRQAGVLAIVSIACLVVSCGRDYKTPPLPSSVIRVGMSFAEADARLSKKYGKGDWHLAKKMPEKDWGYREYAMDIHGYTIIDITYFPTNADAKVMSIRLWALSSQDKTHDTSFRVNEIDLNNL